MKIAFVGGGNMARAILGGLLARGARPADITVVEVDAAARERLAQDFGVAVLPQPGAALAGAEVVVMAVKPQQMREAAAALAPCARRSARGHDRRGHPPGCAAPLAGRPARDSCARCPTPPRWCTPASPGCMPRATCRPRIAPRPRTLLAAVGATLWFDEEADLDAVTAVSGSGPAYVFYAMEALEQAARELGLAGAPARALALATFAGAAKLAAERGEEPARLRAQVTSKGGTTERALEVLDAGAVRQRFVDAVKAACERSRELGDALGKD